MNGQPVPAKTAAQISVRLTPRGGRDAIEGWTEGLLHVRVTAPPVDGRANEALIRLIARAVGRPPSSVSIVSGARSRRKRIAIEGLAQEQAERLLGRLGA